jgi:signal transduction histidine kinase
MQRKALTSHAGSARKRKAKRARATATNADGAAIERVIAVLAHDIRTPLTGILALAELLAASDLSDRQRRWIVALRKNADHLNALTTLVVDAARGNNLALRAEAFDPREVAAAAAASLSARAEAAGLGCATTIPPDLPARVVGDPVRLRAALENLIDNAVKFTQRGSVALTVGAKPAGRAHVLTFSVSDTGIGMSAAEIRRLFRPYAQAHAGIAERYGGAGLGLSLVRRLARAMGGDLKVASRPGEGSTFQLAVKVKAASAREGG